MSDLDVRPAKLSALHGGSTSAARHFRRNHYPFPENAPAEIEVGGALAEAWVIGVDGLRILGFVEHDVVLECAGHRRAELDPPVDGVQWKEGALSQGRWTGVPLFDVLASAGVLAQAVEVVLWGSEGEFARSISVRKALYGDAMIAWSLDGEPIPRELGGPLRAIVPGHYAVDSVKWLKRIEVVTEPFDGHFQVEDYCLFGAEGIPDGTQLHELPVSSLVTSTERTRIAGVAWGGEIVSVEIEVDGTPHVATLGEPLGPYAFTPWELAVDLPSGSHTAASRATDSAGRTQPDRPLWNVRGYANSSVHRVTFDLH